MAIKQPHNQRFSLGKYGTVVLTWAATFAAVRNGNFDRKQAYIDSEVLRYCAPLVPLKTGNLINSGTRGTKIGSGEVVYNADYSARQYYHTATTRPYDPHRGAKWFERMKAAHKQDILNGVKKI